MIKTAMRPTLVIAAMWSEIVSIKSERSLKAVRCRRSNTMRISSGSYSKRLKAISGMAGEGTLERSWDRSDGRETYKYQLRVGDHLKLELASTRLSYRLVILLLDRLAQLLCNGLVA